MSNPLFQARFEVTGVTLSAPGVWTMSGTVHDSSVGFAPSDAQVGDLVFDEDSSTYVGIVNAWQVTEIVSAGPGLSLVVKVEYNEPGSPAGYGEPVPGSCAICRNTVGDLELSQAPAQGWSQISETLSNAIRNYDGRTISASGVQGYQGAQGTLGVDGVQGPQGTLGTNGVQGAQGPQGVGGTKASVLLDAPDIVAVARIPGVAGNSIVIHWVSEGPGP